MARWIEKESKNDNDKIPFHTARGVLSNDAIYSDDIKEKVNFYVRKINFENNRRHLIDLLIHPYMIEDFKYIKEGIGHDRKLTSHEMKCRFEHLTELELRIAELKNNLR